MVCPQAGQDARDKPLFSDSVMSVAVVPVEADWEIKHSGTDDPDASDRVEGVKVLVPLLAGHCCCRNRHVLESVENSNRSPKRERRDWRTVVVGQYIIFSPVVELRQLFGLSPAFVGPRCRSDNLNIGNLLPGL